MTVVVQTPITHIREYRDADADAVARMWRESASAWPGGGPGGGEHSTAARVMQDQRDLNTLATLVSFLPDPETGEERAVGYCSLFEYTAEQNTAYVGTLSAHPAWHGRGVGRDLLRVALERTVALGYARLDLNTWAGNLKAVPLYKKSGYFWVPDTTVKMENYLPLIFRIPAAQEFFQHADWYRDFKRDLSVRPDDEKRGNVEVYIYAWERDGRSLTVVIDRRAKGVTALDTDAFAVSTGLDDPRLPIGGSRQVTWRLENRGDRPVAVSVLAEGEDAVRCSVQLSGVVERADVWAAPVTAEEPAVKPPSNRPRNRVKSTVIVDGQPVQLVAGAQVSQPVALEFDRGKRFFLPGVAQIMWLTLDNPFDEPSRGTLRLSATRGAQPDQDSIDFAIEPRARASLPISLRVDRAGAETLRVQAEVTLGGAELRTKVFSADLYCGDIGEIFVEQTDEYVRPCTDRFAVWIGLKETGSWMPSFSVFGREAGGSLLSHSTSIGPPFVPSAFVNCTWTARVERRAAAVLVATSTEPPAYPGLTFERHLLISPSGVIRVTYRLTNAGSVPRTLQINSGTSVNLSDARGGTYAAAHLRTGLVVENSHRFPDWTESDVSQPDRFAESWMAEFGDAWVGATIWSDAKEVYEVQAGWSTPDLVLDVGTIAPGGCVETAPIYVYGGQGDWKTARSLWRQLVAPDGSRDSLDARPAHRARLERFAFDGDRAQSRIAVESERTRTLSGEVRLELDDRILASGRVDSVKLGAPAHIPFDVDLPSDARAVLSEIILDHERTSERFEAPLLRLGNARALVRVESAAEGGLERVCIDNGRLRMTIIPSQMGRMSELSVVKPDGSRQNQLFAPADAPDVFVWFNPWYGGIHPTLDVGRGYPGGLTKEKFTWTETERAGAFGINWRGITVTTRVTGADWSGVRPANGLDVQVSYLAVGDGNAVAFPVRVENTGVARVEGTITVAAFLQPGGNRHESILHYERDGRVHTQKRVHGGLWGSSEAWCAVSGPHGAPAIALVPGAMNARVGELRDMGLEGVHPALSFALRLAPGETFDSVGYVVLAEDVAQARCYRTLRTAGALV